MDDGSRESAITPSCAHLTPGADPRSLCYDCLVAQGWDRERAAIPSGRVARRLYIWQRDVGFDRALTEFNRLRGDRPTSAPRSRTQLILVALSAFLVLLDLAVAAFGLDLILFSHDLRIVAGILLLLVAVELRPRLPRHETEVGRLRPTDAPALFALLNRVAVATGTTPPTRIAVTDEYNAACGRSGWRRTTFLELGLPLWAVLGPDARVALLGHEFGHLVNNDPRGGLLTGPALTTFGRLAHLLDPFAMFSAPVARARPSQGALLRVVEIVGSILLWPALWTISRLLLVVHIGINAIAVRDWQRAEYYADAQALQLGGTEGAASLMESTVLQHAATVAVEHAALHSADPRAWQRAGQLAISDAARRRSMYETRSVREGAPLFATHPPSGLRAELVRSWPASPRGLSVPADEMAIIDAELQKQYARVSRGLRL
jgi:Zn-dependent protease with chaperone function